MLRQRPDKTAKPLAACHRPCWRAEASHHGRAGAADVCQPAFSAAEKRTNSRLRVGEACASRAVAPRPTPTATAWAGRTGSRSAASSPSCWSAGQTSGRCTSTRAGSSDTASPCRSARDRPQIEPSKWPKRAFSREFPGRFMSIRGCSGATSSPRRLEIYRLWMRALLASGEPAGRLLKTTSRLL